LGSNSMSFLAVAVGVTIRPLSRVPGAQDALRKMNQCNERRGNNCDTFEMMLPPRAPKVKVPMGPFLHIGRF